MIITILRKPLEGTVAKNALTHGCGAINIDATRISTSDNLNGGAYAKSTNERHDGKEHWRYERGKAGLFKQPTGRWPANFILFHHACELKKRAKDQHRGEETLENWACVEGCPVKELDQQSGGASRFFKQFKKCLMKDMIEYFKTMITPPVEDACVIVSKPSEINFDSYLEEGAVTPSLHGIILLGEPTKEESQKIQDILKPGGHVVLIPDSNIGHKGVITLEDIGFEVRDAIFVAEEADKFYYTPKASRSERDAGLQGFEEKGNKRKNIHPTVKPITIMEWCARDLEVGSTVVDPFMGSGTTGIAMSRKGHNFIGIELNSEYAQISEQRIRHWMPINTEIKSENRSTK